jgi:hypothetical protein
LFKQLPTLGLFLKIGDHDPGAFPSELQAYSPTDSRTTSSDKGNTTLQGHGFHICLLKERELSYQETEIDKAE